MCAPTAAFWVAAIWLARDLPPWAVTLTDALVVAGLITAYASAWAVAGSLTRPPRLALLRATSTTLVLIAMLAMAETPAALGLLDYSHLWSVASGEWSGPASGFVADSTLAFARPAHTRWVGRPRSDMAVAWNLPVRAERPQSFTTDAQGFRNRREIGRAEIALVGDSYVEGAYVSDEDTVAVALEQLAGLNVVNLGRSGYGTLQELEVLRRFALPRQPRLVAWFFFEGNDLYDDLEFENARDYLGAHGRYASSRSWSFRRFREASFTVNSFLLLRRLLDPVVPVAVPTFGWFRDEHGEVRKLYFYRDAVLGFGDFERARLEKAKAAFREGAAICREHGVELLLVFIPAKFRVYGERCVFPPESPCREWRVWDLQARFAEFCAAEGIPLLDLTLPMREAAAGGRVLYAPEDSHWNRAGHRFVAEVLSGRVPRSSGP